MISTRAETCGVTPPLSNNATEHLGKDKPPIAMNAIEYSGR